MPRKLKESHKITLEFNTQQYKLIEFLREDGRFGKTDDEIMRSVIKKAMKERLT